MAIDVAIAAGGLLAIAALVALWRFTSTSPSEFSAGVWPHMITLEEPIPVGEPTLVPPDEYWRLPAPRAPHEVRSEVSFPNSEIVFVAPGRRRDEVVVDVVLDRPDTAGRLGEPASLTLAGESGRAAARSYRTLRRWSDGRLVELSIAIGDSGPIVDVDSGSKSERMRLIAGSFTSTSFGGGADGSGPISS